MARSSLTAALTTFVTGTPNTPVRQRRNGAMPDSLRGAAKVMTVRERSDMGINQRSKTLAWQTRAWQFFDEIGEVHYVSSFIGACLSRCTLTIGVPDSNGHIGPVFDEDGTPLEGMTGAEDALALLRSLRGDVGGQGDLLRAMGPNLGVAGEFYLVGFSKAEGTAAADSVDDLRWEVLSTDEFRRVDKGYERIPFPGANPQFIADDGAYVLRVWRSHPRFSAQADSALRALDEILEELLLLTREVRGEALSRLACSQLLVIPEEIEYPDDDNDDALGESGDSFTRDLISTMVTPITDKASAAAVVPFVMRAPGDLIEKIRLIDLSPLKPSDSASKRTEAVQRFAQGIDLPVEIVQGTSNSTFANAVVIDDSLFKSHIEPILETICGGLTSGFLRPAMGDTPFVVHYDATELVSRPNRAQDAKDLHDRFAISDSTLRTSSGFSESDAPEDDEVAARVERTRAAAKPFTDGNTSNPGNRDKAQDGPGGNGPGSDVQQGQSDDKGQALAASIEAAAEICIDQAVQRAGNRLRSLAMKHPVLKDTLALVSSVDVPATLGPKRVAALTPNDDLFTSQFDTLWTWALREVGSRHYADELRDACFAIAAQRVYDPRGPFPFTSVPKPRDDYPKPTSRRAGIK